jgi:hypothetical protein
MTTVAYKCSLYPDNLTMISGDKNTSMLTDNPFLILGNSVLFYNKLN